MTEEERKAAALERIAAARAKKEDRERKSADDEIVKLEREAAEAEAVEDACSQYGELGKELYLVKGPDYLVIVRRPEYVTFKKFLDAGKFTTEARDKLGRPCVVYPDRAAYAKLASERPGVIVAVADAASLLCDVGRIELEGKSGS